MLKEQTGSTYRGGIKPVTDTGAEKEESRQIEEPRATRSNPTCIQRRSRVYTGGHPTLIQGKTDPRLRQEPIAHLNRNKRLRQVQDVKTFAQA